MTQEPQHRDGGVLRARRRGRTIAIGFSLVAHIFALALLARTATPFHLPAATFTPDLTIDLVRSIPLEQSRQNPVAAPRAAVSSPSAAATQTARRSQAPQPPLPPLPAPNRPAPRPAPSSPVAPPAPAPAPPGPQTRPGSPSSAPSASAAAPGPGGDVHGAVRAAIGCSHEEFLRLNAAERAACERKMAERPTGAFVDPISPLKRRDFDRQAAADARRRDHEGPMSNPIGRCEGIGSNFGTGCLPPEAMHHAGSGGATPIGSPEPRP